MLGYVVGGRVFVMLNVGGDVATVAPGLEGAWRLVAASDGGGRVDLEGAATLRGRRADTARRVPTRDLEGPSRP